MSTRRPEPPTWKQLFLTLAAGYGLLFVLTLGDQASVRARVGPAAVVPVMNVLAWPCPPRRTAFLVLTRGGAEWLCARRGGPPVPRRH